MGQPSGDAMTVGGYAGSTRAKVGIAVGILAVFVATLVALDRHGRKGRVFSPGREVLEVERPDQAYDAWKARGARGRTLLLFGPFPHLWRGGYADAGVAPGPLTFLERAALDNVVRRIYFLAPDESWDALFGVDRPGFYRRVPRMERGIYMHYSIGLPVIATTPTSLPALRERALVYVDKDRFDLGAVEALLTEKGIDADVIVASTGL